VIDGEDEDTTFFPTFDDLEEIFQPVDVEDTTCLLMYDADDDMD